ncbi:MAG: MFS transporter [Pseudomonadota bacterium]
MTARKRIWGWFFFDWASQPYSTLLITFIFAPYIEEIIGDGAEAQATWGFTVGAAGICIALMAPILGAVADIYGNRMRWIWVFSLFYVVGAAGLWLAVPVDYPLMLVLFCFAFGLVGMEFATIFTNSMLPDLGPREDIGRISGKGWAFGYTGGLLALVAMLLLFAESATTGKTLLGIDPILGLDASAREGTRFVGPFTAIWYVIFVIPFFLWVRDPKPAQAPEGALRTALSGLANTIKTLPQTPSLFAYLGSSMFYRDALNGMYFFGGIYAAGVLNWTIIDVGIFGILAILAGAVFAWIGGYADDRFGPKTVIRICIIVLTIVSVCIIFVSRDSVFGTAVDPSSRLPDIAFYVLGAIIGAAGGVIQSASRSMMVRQAKTGRMAEGFGLYALTGKATSFVAPLSVGAVTSISGSQQLGITPLILLFLVGLVLLSWVKTEGDQGL